MSHLLCCWSHGVVPAGPTRGQSGGGQCQFPGLEAGQSHRGPDASHHDAALALQVKVLSVSHYGIATQLQRLQTNLPSELPG